MDVTGLRIGNYIKKRNEEEVLVVDIKTFNSVSRQGVFYNPIELTEEWFLKFGFSIISENSAGIRYGYVINGIFDSDITFIFWKTTKEKGKFFRKDLRLKYVHQLQNLYFALTGEELIAQ